MSTKSILLRGGTVLTHGTDDHIHPVRADILIVGNVISKIEEAIEAPAGAEIFDCFDKILSPGFIDTHHHMWQTLLKGRHADQMLLDYMPAGNYIRNIRSIVSDTARKFDLFNS
jgi:cytosine/adenosine deaminase-related metal-dependent hydrolase